MKKFHKKGQEVLGMSFGMIFSILLIVFFIVVAFIVVRSFLNTQKCVQVGNFITDFKEEVKKAFNSDKEEILFTGRLSSDIKNVCFYDTEKEIKVSGSLEVIADNIGIYEGENANMFFYPRDKACNIPYANVEYLNITKIAGDNNLKCFEVNNGVVEILIKKGLRERLVGLG